jgi:hypothetical protein
VPWKAVTFDIQEKYYNFSTPTSTKAWEDLRKYRSFYGKLSYAKLTKRKEHIGNQGWVIFNKPQDFAWLPRGIPMSRGREKILFSAFHGLHCLVGFSPSSGLQNPAAAHRKFDNRDL